MKEEDQDNLPRIPVQPIGYDEAEIFLRSISDENPPPPEWVGNLDAPYNLGPTPFRLGWEVRINVSTTNEMRRTYNTIGILRGSVEDGKSLQNIDQMKLTLLVILHIFRSLCSSGKSS